MSSSGSDSQAEVSSTTDDPSPPPSGHVSQVLDDDAVQTALAGFRNSDSQATISVADNPSPPDSDDVYQGLDDDAINGLHAAFRNHVREEREAAEFEESKAYLKYVWIACRSWASQTFSTRNAVIKFATIVKVFRLAWLLFCWGFIISVLGLLHFFLMNTFSPYCSTSSALASFSYFGAYLPFVPDYCSQAKLDKENNNSAKLKLGNTVDSIEKMFNLHSSLRELPTSGTAMQDFTSGLQSFAQLYKEHIPDYVELNHHIRHLEDTTQQAIREANDFQNSEYDVRTQMYTNIKRMLENFNVVEDQMSRSYFLTTLYIVGYWINPEFFLRNSEHGILITRYMKYTQKMAADMPELLQKADKLLELLTDMKNNMTASRTFVNSAVDKWEEKCAEPTSSWYVFTRQKTFPKICGLYNASALRSSEGVIGQVTDLIATTTDMKDHLYTIHGNLRWVERYMKSAMIRTATASDLNFDIDQAMIFNMDYRNARLAMTDIVPTLEAFLLSLQNRFPAFPGHATIVQQQTSENYAVDAEQKRVE